MLRTFDAVPMSAIQKLFGEKPEIVAALSALSCKVTDQGMTIVAGLEGGIIQGASFKAVDGEAGGIDLYINDYDTEGCEPNELISFEDRHGTSTARCYGATPINDPAFIDKVMAAIEARDAAEFDVDEENDGQKT